jgi:type IV secretory pathway VirB2 component (pilin)
MIANLGFGSADTGGGDALPMAAHWLQALLLGTIASIIAIVAIAVVGLMMLNGRIDIRRGITVVLGCFLLFGAPVIAAGLLGAISENAAQPTPYTAEPGSTNPSPRMPGPSRTPAPYDPYAGASMPSGN